MHDDSAATDFDRTLRAAHARCGAALCVGIDPVVEHLPQHYQESQASRAFESFSAGVIEAISPHAAAVKFQSACYERLGARGIDALHASIAAAREANLAVILDAKRGDIGVSARHYAAAARELGAQAITVNAYLGMETLEPYLEAGLAIFVLVRTSNPGSKDVQDLPLRSGGTLALHMGRLVAELGRQHPGVHAVVGATQGEQGAVLRAVMPEQLFLLPGLGTQGATIDDLAAFAKLPGQDPADPARGLLPTASRSIIYAGDAQTGRGNAWQDAVGAAAQALNDQLRQALAGPASTSA